MTKEQFIRSATEEVEEAVMRAQGIGDWMPNRTPEQAAKNIAALLPGYIWTDE